MRSANIFHANTARIATFLTARSIAWAIENPANSWLCWQPLIKELVVDGVGVSISTHFMFGGQRNKTTRFRCFPVAAFNRMNTLCSANHPCLPCGRTADGSFAMDADTIYPEMLCETIVNMVSDLLQFEKLPPLRVAPCTLWWLQHEGQGYP